MLVLSGQMVTYWVGIAPTIEEKTYDERLSTRVGFVVESEPDAGPRASTILTEPPNLNLKADVDIAVPARPAKTSLNALDNGERFRKSPKLLRDSLTEKTVASEDATNSSLLTTG